MWNFSLINYLIIFVFVVGYLAIIFEYKIKINKTASAIIMAAVSWTLLFFAKGQGANISLSNLDKHLGNASQLIFFLLGVMTLVEMIDSHKGFKIITNLIQTRSKKKMLWIVGFLSFFLSAVLDNLTTTILMISILRKVVPDRKERLFLGSSVIIAANAGGAWTPIGDVTTTMLWIKGNLTPLGVVKSLFLPCFFSLIIMLFLLSFSLKGKYSFSIKEQESIEPGGKLVFFLGMLALIFVPVFEAITHLSPFMGVFLGLGILWVVTDLLHNKYETRKHLRVPYVLTKIDTAGVLFFLGILLCINSLEITNVLKNLSLWLDMHIQNTAILATILGLISSVIDNVPLVAATTGMYDLSLYPTDSSLWQMIAYCAGTGGSIFIIGSAAGVALMGLEKVDFVWYMKRMSLIALAGYLAGMVLYLILHV